MKNATRILLCSFTINMWTHFVFPLQAIAVDRQTNHENTVESKKDWEDVKLENTNTTPDQTRLAITALLGASNDFLPKNESCEGFWTSDISQPSRVKHLVSSVLSAFDSGENRIFGKCEENRCLIEIRHRNGEDVFHARIRFRTHKGRVVNSSLDCFSTP